MASTPNFDRRWRAYARPAHSRVGLVLAELVALVEQEKFVISTQAVLRAPK
jgi:hypothetical protein